MLLINLLFGCASTAQVEPNNTTNNDSAAALEQPSATPSHTSPMPTATLTTTATPPPTSSATPTPTATATVTLVPTTQPTATPQPPTSTPSPTSTSAPNPTPTPLTEAGPLSESSAEQGLAVYRGQYCGICHQLDAAGTTGLFGPSHNGIGSTAAQHIQDPGYTGTATTAAEYIRESILNPAIYRVPGFEYSPHPMPAYTHLTQMEVDALVQFLLQQK